MFADNHSSEEIPATETVSGIRIAQVYVGIAITLPAFLVASQLFAGLGLFGGLVALGATGAVLFVLASLTMAVGTKTRLSTYTIIESVFGRWVAKMINLLLGLTLLGWFAVTVSLFAEALAGATRATANTSAPIWLLKLIGGVAMIGLTLYGFKAIDRLARIAVPLLALTLIAMFVRYIQGVELPDNLPPPQPAVIGSVGMGISILIGAFSVAVTITPDIARYAKSLQASTLASFLSFGLGSILVMLLAGYPTILTGQTSFVDNMILAGLGWPALFVVVFATITTNISNLFSTSLSFRQLFADAKDYQVTGLCGVAGTAISLIGIENSFVPFLMFLGIVIPPIAGVYLAENLLLRRRYASKSRHTVLNPPALLAWLLASVLAYITTNEHVVLIGVPALEGIFAGLVFYVILAKCAGLFSS